MDIGSWASNITCSNNLRYLMVLTVGTTIVVDVVIDVATKKEVC